MKEYDEDMFRPRLVDFSHVSHGILRDTLYLDSPNHVAAFDALKTASVYLAFTPAARLMLKERFPHNCYEGSMNPADV